MTENYNPVTEYYNDKTGLWEVRDGEVSTLRTLGNEALIAVASDHAGLDLKLPMLEVLRKRRIGFTDFGTHDHQSTDYPYWGKLVGREVASGRYGKGLLICGTGIGISIAANKIEGIRAAACADVFSAKMSREHNNCNVLAMGARVLGVGLATELLNAWLDTDFEEGGRHQQRVDMLNDPE